MLCFPFPPWRGVLTPQAALGLVTSHLENARIAQSPEQALGLCKDAEKALARIRTSVRKSYVLSSRAQDRALCNDIATAYSEIGKLLDSLGLRTKAQAIYKNEEKWGGRAQLPGQSSSRSTNVNSPPAVDSSADSSTSPIIEPTAYPFVVDAVSSPPPHSLI
ncbi:hypothetical protein EDD21DRAFT_143073 [Dissophora ornata]|nr:hypothetical protein EDD21DRAFT_143073 [Dissophora ornata]